MPDLEELADKLPKTETLATAVGEYIWTFVCPFIIKYFIYAFDSCKSDVVGIFDSQ